MSTTRPDCPKARAIEARHLALILCGHGAEGASATAERHADAIRQRRIFGTVRACCLKGRPSLEETLASIETRPVHIIPLLMSRGLTWQTLRDRLAGASQIAVDEPVGLDLAVVEIMRRRAIETCQARAWRPGEARLILVAHGTERDGAAREAAVEHAKRIEAEQNFARVLPAFLSDSPSLEDALSGLAGEPCVLVGLFAERGVHGMGDIERAIRRSGQRIAYAGPIGDDPAFTAIIIRRALAAAGMRSAA